MAHRFTASERAKLPLLAAYLKDAAVVASRIDTIEDACAWCRTLGMYVDALLPRWGVNRSEAAPNLWDVAKLTCADPQWYLPEDGTVGSYLQYLVEECLADCQ